ncbi:MAG: hypothetical protein ABJL67_13465 [Sulfitobacter sp.]
MPLTFPRDMTDLTRWSEPKLRLMHRQELSRVQGGLTSAKDMGPSLWTAEWTSVPIPLADADAAMASFRSLRGALRTFFLYPFTHPQPRMTSPGDLDGVSVTVDAIGANFDGISLAGLPAGFEMVAGDFLSIATAVGGTEFLQLVDGGIADGSGRTPEMEMTPFVRPAVLVGNPVALIKPPIEMRLEPDTLDDPYVSKTHRKITFKSVQVVR